MKKPDNYMSMKRHELILLAAKMNVWNAEQAVSDREHREHYENEILPLYDRASELWNDWMEEHDS